MRKWTFGFLGALVWFAGFTAVLHGQTNQNGLMWNEFGTQNYLLHPQQALVANPVLGFIGLNADPTYFSIQNDPLHAGWTRLNLNVNALPVVPVLGNATSSGSGQVSGKTYSVSGTPTYVPHQWFVFQPDVTCIAGATLQIDGPGPLPLQKQVAGKLVPVIAGDCIGGLSYIVIVIGNVPNAFELVSPSASNHFVTLQWTASTTPGVTGYNIYRSIVSGGPYDRLTLTPVNDVMYDDITVNANTIYYYVATALIDTLEGGFSNEAQAKVPV